MKRASVWIGLALVIGGVGGYWVGQNDSAAQDESGGNGIGSSVHRPPAVRTPLSERAAPFSEDGPRHSLREARQSAIGAIRVQQLGKWAAAVPEHEIEQALAECVAWQKIDPQGDGALAVRFLLTRWAAMDTEAALAAALRLDTDGGAAAIVLSAIEPKNAAPLLQRGASNGTTESAGLLGKPGGERLAAAVAREWALRDQSAALAWVKDLPENVRDAPWSAAITASAPDDPALAATLLEDMPPSSARELTSAQVAAAWAMNEPQQAMIWAAGLDDAERHRAVPQALAMWSERDPQSAAQWLNNPSINHQLSTINSPETRRAVAAVAGTWSQRDAPATAAWVSAQPEGPIKSEGMSHLLWHWTASDPEAASSWLDGQPAGIARDEGIAMLAQHLSNSDPEAAAAWASAMTSGRGRTEALQRAVNAWLRRDHAAATEWLIGRAR